MRFYGFLSALILGLCVSFSNATNGGTIAGNYDTGFVVIDSEFNGLGLYVEGSNGIVGIADNWWGIIGQSNNNEYAGLEGIGGVGVYAQGSDEGVFGLAGYGGTGVQGLVFGDNSIGVDAEADGDPEDMGNTSIGTESYATGDNAYGIYASADGVTTSLAGYFDGAVTVTGDCECYPSDIMFKKNINPLDGGLNKIMALKPKTYDMKNDEFKGKINLPKGHRYGLISQDVEAVLPELVHDFTTPPKLQRTKMKSGMVKTQMIKGGQLKFKALDYVSLVPILVEAIQEQQAEIQKQGTEIDALKAH